MQQDCLFGGGLAGSGETTLLRIGITGTRHPRKGAVEQPEVPRRERLSNQCCAADSREDAGVYVLLRVNVCGISG